ncbi:MAG: TIGR00730 family Rossman fold protein [Chloroflexi bacterium]|nr:TIGR00730 family Rossman fold protein [Chloroflexota bacterium]
MAEEQTISGTKLPRRAPTPPPGRPTQDAQLLSPPTEEPITFTSSDPWRVLRIQGEFVEGFETLATTRKAITIFGSARVKPGHPQYQAAVEVARLLGEAGYAIITGGGPGIMEAGNRGAKLAGVPSIGLNIELPFEQGSNRFVDVPVDFHYFFVRKTMFVKYAQGFVIFPGGFGTMDELFEALTLIQTGKIENFPVVLFDSHYWSGLLAWIRDVMLAEGKIGPSDIDLMMVTDSPQEAVHFIIEGSSDNPERRAREASAQAATREAYSEGYSAE